MQTYMIIVVGLLLTTLLLSAKEETHKYEFTVTRIALDLQKEKEAYEKSYLPKDANRTMRPEKETTTR